MNTSKQTKTIIYTILVILIVAGALFSFVKYKDNKSPAKQLSLREITQLPGEERIKALEERTKELMGKVKSLTNSTATEIQYSAYIQLAEAQLELGKYDGAFETLNKISEENKSNNRVAAAYVRAYKGIGDIVKAKELSAANITLYDEDASIWLAHLEVNSDLPNDQLKAFYLQAIPATKSNVDVMISYAKFSEKIGDKATAIAAWETAINGDPGNESKYREEIARLR